MTDVTPARPDEDYDYNRLYAAAGVFLAEYCAATNTDRGALERQVVTVELTDDEGTAPSLSFDLGVKMRPGALYDSAPLDEANARLDEVDPPTPSTEETT